MDRNDDKGMKGEKKLQFLCLNEMVFVVSLRWTKVSKFLFVFFFWSFEKHIFFLISTVPGFVHKLHGMETIFTYDIHILGYLIFSLVDLFVCVHQVYLNIIFSWISRTDKMLARSWLYPERDIPSNFHIHSNLPFYIAVCHSCIHEII